MSHYDRLVKIAFNRLTGEILDADKVFNATKDAFNIRTQYNKNKLQLSCCECYQDLIVSTSKFDRLYFKHKPGHNYCILSDGKLSPDEHEKYTKILESKESERHKELKNKIGNLLKIEKEIDVDSIAIDDKFIIRGNEKRRPDVYCKYRDIELVFEIQLSDLTLSYILSRYNFYKKHGMFLIWILDNFDVHNQKTFERDIKYLTKYENFFKLDESKETFHLECEYKFPFLSSENKLLTKWLKKTVPLNKIKFDISSYQVYYYNFGDNKEITEKKRIEIERKRNEEERIRIEKERETNANERAYEVIDTIKRLREEKSQNFSYALDLIELLDEYQLKVLNTWLDFSEKEKLNKPPLIHWLKTATEKDIAFINFILGCSEIKLDVNAVDCSGNTAFQAIFDNKSILKDRPIIAIFKRGYYLTESDKEFFNNHKNIENYQKNDIYTYELCNRLSNRKLVDLVFKHIKILLILESAYRHEIIGFNYKANEWIAFANNAIQYHNEYWEYIELALKRYGLWKTLIKSDKKGTFEKKIQNFYSKLPAQKYDIDEVFQDLYPESYF